VPVCRYNGCASTTKGVAVERDQALIDEIYRRKVIRARQLTPAQRLLASLEHSDAMVEWMRAGIRHQHPSASEHEVSQILIERINRVRARSRRP
jgi:hypothetical protein